MTVREMLDIIDSTKQNDVNEAIKVRWINDVEGRVQCEIYRVDPKHVKAVAAEDDCLSVPDAYSMLYMLFVVSMIEFTAGNYTDYTRLTTEFEKALELYAKWYIRNA